MDASSLAILFYSQVACLALLIVSFVSWFRLRDTPQGDLVCFGAATACLVLLIVSTMALGPLGCAGAVCALPGLIVYLWFGALRRHRRQQSRIRQWCRQQGYRIATVEAQPFPQRAGSIRDRAQHRVTVRRIADGQFLVGWIVDSAAGFEVIWDPVPTKHVGPGLHVPNPPHAEPPGPSKE